MNFTHLHVHSNFSLLDGAASVYDLVEAAADMGMEALALTDHNGLYGAVRFCQAAIEAGIKPIIGAELTVEPLIGRSKPQKSDNPEALPSPLRHQPHLLLLAEDNEGYSNLCRLVTAARLGVAQYAGPFSEDFSHVDRDNPVLPQADLRKYSSHLIALSGCPRGEIPQLIMAGDRRRAARVAQYYKGLFGPENFYTELQNNLLPPPYHILRHRLGELAEHVDVKTVATNNVHYVDRDHARLQDVLVCINNNQAVDEPHPDRKVNCEYDLKSPAQMAGLFPDQPEAVRNTQRIAERCHPELDLEHFHFPAFDLQMLQEEDCGHYPPPRDGENEREYLRRLCYAGAKWRYGDITPEVGQRLEHELQIIQ
ncbi:MAG: PHP domain-containing protein, partial [Armatimonadota bacterium]